MWTEINELQGFIRTVRAIMTSDDFIILPDTFSMILDGSPSG